MKYRFESLFLSGITEDYLAELFPVKGLSLGIDYLRPKPLNNFLKSRGAG